MGPVSWKLETAACPPDGGAHLFRRSAADVVAAGQRASHGQHAVDVIFDQRRELLQFFQRQLGESGILDALVAKGVQENDTILIGDYQFDYIF